VIDPAHMEIRMKKTEKSKIQHILSEINNTFDLDKSLKKLSLDFFSEVDKDSLIILQLIAKHGPQNEYQLGLRGETRNLNRYSVRRRLIGIDAPGRSLKQTGYVLKAKEKKHKTGKISKEYGITIKGLLASLTGVKFEDSYLAKNLLHYFQDEYNNDTIAYLSLVFVKYSIALFVIWHLLTGLKLTHKLNIKQYLLNWILTNPILNINQGTHSFNRKLNNDFLNITTNYFITLSVLHILINRFTTDVKKGNKSYRHVLELLHDDNYSWKAIKNWPVLIEELQLGKKQFLTFSDSYQDDQGMMLYIEPIKIRKRCSKILEKLEIKNYLIPENPHLP